MDTSLVTVVARSYMRKHGLEDWSLQFVRVHSFAGRCNYRRRIIQLNENWTERAMPADVRNTILHEIAHALVGHGHGHNSVWHDKFIGIGGNGETKATDHGLHATKKYVVHCAKGCDDVAYRQRKDVRLINGRVCLKHRAKLHYVLNV